jgi:hypothetical protein
MKTLNILIATRNRLTGLIDTLMSVKRLVLNSRAINIVVTIQDNSDLILPEFVINYFSRYFYIYYYKSLRLLPMSENWNQGLMKALNSNPDYISVLADRRLATLNLLHAVESLEKENQAFICFDHQSIWLNSKRITNGCHTHKLKLLTGDALLAAIGSAQINWNYPMLLNCVVNIDFMLELKKRYGTFSEGSSPDMNFLARIADMEVGTYYLYDAPCIITNARHAALSNGSTALQSGTIHEIEHTRLSGTEAYPSYMENFVTANITGSLARYWGQEKMKKIINPLLFFQSSCLELSYPKHYNAFEIMKKSLQIFIEEQKIDISSHNQIEAVKHCPSTSQQYPINSCPDIANAPALRLMSHVERPNSSR